MRTQEAVTARLEMDGDNIVLKFNFPTDEIKMTKEQAKIFAQKLLARAVTGNAIAVVEL